jgi:hypothetical protein
MILFPYCFTLDAIAMRLLMRADPGTKCYFNVDAANDDIGAAGLGRNSQGLSGASAVRSAWFVQQTQFDKYHTLCGHGFTAEDANAMRDLWLGRSVKRVGTSNTLNGPDRISAGVAVQTKYCASASASLKATFGADRQYRYPRQVLEVPPEQADDVVAALALAITEGRMGEVTDPALAGSLVRKGSVSHEQSRRIARKANRDSLTFDARLHAANAAISAGISFGADIFNSRQKGRARRHRAAQAVSAAAVAGTKTLFTGVVTSQLLRTQGARKMTVMMRRGVRVAVRTSVGRKAVNAVAGASLGKAAVGAAAVIHCSKLMRSSMVGGTVTLVVGIVPNIGRAMVGKMTWSQLGRNSVEDAASTAAGMAGWTLCYTFGSIACATFLTGGAVLVGAALIGTVGAAAAGEGARLAARKTVDSVVGKETMPRPSVAVPDWLLKLLVAQHATAAECAQILGLSQEQLRPWSKFDRTTIDVEAMEMAKYEVTAILSSLRTEPQMRQPCDYRRTTRRDAIGPVGCTSVIGRRS